MMPFLKWTLVIFLLNSASAAAGNLLPVAQGHQSAAFVLERNTAQLPAGARVEFTYRDPKDIPRKIEYVTGFVLGTQDGVVFFELSDRNAAILALRRAESDVGYRKVSDPEPEEVAVRRDMRDGGHAILLAPQMRRLTVSLVIDDATVSKWSPGDMLTFVGARRLTTHSKIDGKWTPGTEYRDISAMFRSATMTENGMFEVTIVADPDAAQHILRAEMEGRLTVEEETKERGASGKRRCHVAQRSQGELIEIEIPCPD